jgi:uncharacterized protein YndB with AHSA1/START domain
MKSRTAAAWLALTLFAMTGPSRMQGETKDLKTGAFEVRQELVLPASPEALYDTMTGDISGWWDHSFSKHPKKMYIEAKPGGGFWEIFNDSGDGVLHATVIVADRGKLLRFTGPLGLSGEAVNMVTTYEFLPDPAGTKLRVTANVSGQLAEGEEKVLDAVWHHFLFDRLKPYVESGTYQKKTP